MGPMSSDGPDDAARASVERLRKVGMKIPRAVRGEVLSHGARAVRPLLALLGEHRAPASAHAAELLGALRAVEAIPALLETLLAGPDEEVSDRLADALGALGPAVVEPVLSALEQVTDVATRATLLNVLARSGVRDERILQALLEAIERGAPGEAPSIAGQYGDPRIGERVEALFHAVEPIDAASAERVVALGIGLVTFKRFSSAHEQKMDTAYTVMRADLQRKIDQIKADPHAPPFDPGAGLFDEGGALDDDDLDADLAALDPHDGIPGEDAAEDAADADDAGGEDFDPALGRNDPCWCGSGKKFKRCHANKP